MGRALLFIRRHIGSSKTAIYTARMLVLKVTGEQLPVPGLVQGVAVLLRESPSASLARKPRLKQVLYRAFLTQSVTC